MSRKSPFLALSCIAVLFSACTPYSYLSVHTDYLSHRTLASYYVNTPDPMLDNPPIGQRLIVSWSIPKHILPGNNLYLKIYMRYWNRAEEIKTEPVTRSRGTVVYAIMNEEYIETRGIMSYKVELIDNGQVISEWKHQVWTEVVHVEHKPVQEDDDDLEDLVF